MEKVNLTIILQMILSWRKNQGLERLWYTIGKWRKAITVSHQIVPKNYQNQL